MKRTRRERYELQVGDLEVRDLRRRLDYVKRVGFDIPIFKGDGDCRISDTQLSRSKGGRLRKRTADNTAWEGLAEVTETNNAIAAVGISGQVASSVSNFSAPTTAIAIGFVTTAGVEYGFWNWSSATGWIPTNSYA